MQNNKEERHPLEGIKSAIYYKKVWVEPYIGGFFLLNHKVKTIEEVDNLIREAALVVNNIVH